MHYLVQWDIDIDADNPHDAALQARETQLRLNSIANVFSVEDENGGKVTVDLEDDQELTQHPKGKHAK
jgi:hypothetical protein